MQAAQIPAVIYGVAVEISVLVQVWGPVSGASNCYDWLTVGRIEKPETLDLDYLKGVAVDIIRHSAYKPFVNAARLKFVSEQKTEMQVTMMDLL
jgi:hypothetical protein